MRTVPRLAVILLWSGTLAGAATATEDSTAPAGWTVAGSHPSEYQMGLDRATRLLPLFHEQAYRFARPDVEGLSASALGRLALEDLSLRG